MFNTILAAWRSAVQAVLIFSAAVAIIWGLWKLGEPWRKYHKEHIAPLEKERASAEARRSEADNKRQQALSNAELFDRNFRAEVRQYQAAKSNAYELLNPLRDRKSELHDDMESVASGLDSWHRRSKSFFGKKGRKIKDDSVLGWFGLEQTVAQKESLERQRSAISSEIGDLKDEMSEIFERKIKPAKEGIQKAFDDEKRLKQFKNQGLNQHHFTEQARVLLGKISAYDAEIARIARSIDQATKAYKTRHVA